MVVGALLLAGLWFLLISPKREEALQLGEQVTEAQGVLDQARSDLSRFEQARAAYRDNYAVLAAVGKAAPAEDATATLLFQIGATARSEKVDFRSFTAGGDPGGRADRRGDPGAARRALLLRLRRSVLPPVGLPGRPAALRGYGGRAAGR